VGTYTLSLYFWCLSLRPTHYAKDLLKAAPPPSIHSSSTIIQTPLQRLLILFILLDEKYFGILDTIESSKLLVTLFTQQDCVSALHHPASPFPNLLRLPDHHHSPTEPPSFFYEISRIFADTSTLHCRCTSRLKSLIKMNAQGMSRLLISHSLKALQRLQ